MYFSAAIALYSVQLAVFTATAFAQCDSDNCLRAVMGEPLRNILINRKVKV